MSTNFVLISLLFIFFLVSVESVVGSSHAVVGDFNAKDCGQTSMTSDMSTECFEWHKDSNPGLKNSRNATIADVPWLAFIVRPVNKSMIWLCSGSLIGSQWVLTSAHCIREKWVPYMLFGTDFVSDPKYQIDSNGFFIKGEKMFPHPDFDDTSSTPNDIGLIKLVRPVRYYDNYHPLFKSLRGICLPEENVINENMEYAMTAGWGLLDPWNDTAQLGYKQILPGENPSFIFANRLDGQGLICQGDSGGPLWQYYMGRAVIIGVTKMLVTTDKQCEAYKMYKIPGHRGFEPARTINVSLTLYTRVSHYIDWIKEVIMFN